MKYLWTIGGGAWNEASSTDELLAGFILMAPVKSLQDSYKAVEVDGSGKKADITNKIKELYEKKYSAKYGNYSGADMVNMLRGSSKQGGKGSK